MRHFLYSVLTDQRPTLINSLTINKYVSASYSRVFVTVISIPHCKLFDAENIIQSSCQLKHLCVLCDFMCLCYAPIEHITPPFPPLCTCRL